MTTLKRDFSAEILDLRGRPMKGSGTMETLSKVLDLALSKVPESEQESLQKAIDIIMGEPNTLGAVVSNALTAPVQGETFGSGEATKRLKLALKIVDGGMVEITTEERDMMKERVSKVYLGALVPGRAAELLETDAKPDLKVVAAE